MILLAALQRRLRHTVRGATAALLVGGMLAACAAPVDTPKGSEATAPTAPTPAQGAAKTAAPAPAVPVTAPVTPAPEVAPGTGTVPASPVKVDTSCRTNADCAVKNVGNCCGYAPACVNVNSPTDPQGVQAECARSGRMSVCGFREISACQCVKGQCEPAASDLDVQ